MRRTLSLGRLKGLVLCSLLLGILCFQRLQAQISHENARNKNEQIFLFSAGHNVSRHDLSAAGYKIQKVLSSNKFLLKVNKNHLNASLGTFQITANSEWKTLENMEMDHGLVGAPFWIYSENVDSTKGVVARIPSLMVLDHYGGNLLMHANSDEVISTLLHLPSVLYLGQEELKPTTEARVLDLNLAPNRVNLLHRLYPNLREVPIAISIKENAFDPDDIDLRGRQFEAVVPSNEVTLHATEMATIIAGAGNSFVTGAGVVRNASITSSGFANIAPDRTEDYQSHDIVVQNHSYGTVIESFYGSLANAYDYSAHENKYLLHVFSAGNQGTAVDSMGRYRNQPGYANLTGNFKMSKNTITVGAVDTTGMVLPFSSAGPAHDGRVKPEVVAYSTIGSSNAAALVSGIAASLQQVHLDRFGSRAPSALVKAAIIATADHVDSSGLSFRTGYGNINAIRAAEVVDRQQVWHGALDHAQTVEMEVFLDPGAQELSVALAWNDPPAIPGAGVALVNDLDVVVIDPMGQEWSPWVLDSTPDVDALGAAPVRKRDSLNNVEIVSLTTAVSGNYRIRVMGTDIPEGPQAFHLAYDLRGSDFRWTFPTASDNIPYNGETTGYLRWESGLDSQEGTIDISLGGGTWQNIAQVALPDEMIRWSPPDDFEGLAQLRMRTSEGVYPSDSFAISVPNKIAVGFDCADSVLVRWTPTAGAQTYRLESLGDIFMRQIGETTDTFAVLDKRLLRENIVRIKPLLSSDMWAIGSLAFDITRQGTTCYLNSAFAEVVEDQGVFVNVFLGTAYGTTGITLERKAQSTFLPITESSIPDSAIVRLLDASPEDGFNQYRARISLQNGQEVISDTLGVFFFAENPFLLFPNPLQLSKDQQLNIFSRQFDQSPLFVLLDASGREVLHQELLSDREALPVVNISSGTYFYRIEIGNQIHSGKLIFRQ